jgi:hypothetical protein
MLVEIPSGRLDLGRDERLERSGMAAGSLWNFPGVSVRVAQT